MALDAKTGKNLWQFQTGSGIIGSPITYELDGVQYVAVPSGGIGGDMIFYYKEPKAGNLWVFALEGGPKREMPGDNLVTRVGGLPQVGQPGQTLGGRVLPGYGFPPTEGSAPIAGEAPPQPTSSSAGPTGAGGDGGEANPLLGNAAAIEKGGVLYRARCFGCHMAAGGSGPKIFRSQLSAKRYSEIVEKGVPGTLMPAFKTLLTADEIRQIHAFTSAYERLP
jgi:mono/diheme cytochrome c family protein